MKPAVLLLAALVCLGALFCRPGGASAEETLLHGPANLTPAPVSDAQIATWLSLRYDTLKETGMSLPGQKEFQTWLVSGRCNWLDGLNLAAGYEIWSPNLSAGSEIRTTRGAVSFQHNNKAAAISLERSSFGDQAREPSYGAIAAFTMQF